MNTKNLVAVITKKKGDKNGNGRDTVLTVYDMSKSYTMMIATALAQLETAAEAIDIEGVSDEDIAQAVTEQRAAWAKTIASSSDGGVAWESTVENAAYRVIQHNTNGNQYVQGYAVISKTIEYDANRPAKVNKRGHRNGVTAAKSQLRKLAAGWKMSAINDETIIYTGETAEALLTAAQA